MEDADGWLIIPIGEREIGFIAVKDLRIKNNKEAGSTEQQLHTAAHED